MGGDHVAVALSPETLSMAADSNLNIELTFSWEHHDLLANNTDLASHIKAAGVDPEQVWSIHLPPGQYPHGTNLTMAATKANVGPILDFIHGQLEAFTDAFLVLHPAKNASYSEQFQVLETLCQASSFDLTLENTPDESIFYTPEDIAFFSFVADEDALPELVPMLDCFGVTIDSAHLPHQESTMGSLTDDVAISIIDNRLQDENLELPQSFTTYLKAQMTACTHEIPPTSQGGETSNWEAGRYGPLLTALIFGGECVRNVHLNDPATDGIPDLTGRSDHHTLNTALDLIRTRDIQVVLPGPYEMEQRDYLEHVDRIRQTLG